MSCDLIDKRLCELIGPDVCPKHGILEPFVKLTSLKQEIDIYQIASNRKLAPRILSIKNYFAPRIQVTESVFFPSIHQGYIIETEAWDNNLRKIYKRASLIDRQKLKQKAHNVLSKFHKLGFYHLDIKLENFVVRRCNHDWEVGLIDFEYSQPLTAPYLEQYFEDEKVFLTKPANWVPIRQQGMPEFAWIEHCNLEGHFVVEDFPKLYPKGFNIKMFSF